MHDRVGTPLVKGSSKAEQIESASCSAVALTNWVGSLDMSDSVSLHPQLPPQSMQMSRNFVPRFLAHAKTSSILCALAFAFTGMPYIASGQGSIATDTLTLPSNPVDDSTPSGTTSNVLRGPLQLKQVQNPSAASRSVEPVLEPVPYVPSEFDKYVQMQAVTNPDQPPVQVRRFGANLMTDPGVASVGQDPLPSIPGDYIVKPGDEIALTIWGSADADLRLTVDRAGQISVPHVGSIAVAGQRYADLSSVISKRVESVFKNFELTATLSQVRAIRVFVTGYAQRPGSLTINGLSSMLHALVRAGGPSQAGSFRDIQLSRGGHQIGRFDLYDLLLKGDRGTDLLLQPDDVIFIGPVGTQVAIVGSVNQQAIFELKPTDSVSDLIRMAGGFSAVADRSRVAVERLADREAGRVAELKLPQHANDLLGTGDLVRVFSAVASVLPQDHQNRRVRIEGEVARPGEIVLGPGATVADALRAAGGMTAAAFPYGTEFTRESVRITQQLNYDRALRDLETDMTKNQASQRTTTAEEATAQSTSAASNTRLIERLRQVRPTGRVVLQIRPDDTNLPDLQLEDGDHIYIPKRGTSVGVFGSVFNTGSFIFVPQHTTGDYVALAGGPTRGADKRSMFLIRANGSVISAMQGSSFWHSGSAFSDTIVEPGDTIFVPQELSTTTFVQDAKDWTQILYQFGLGLAGINALGL